MAEIKWIEEAAVWLEDIYRYIAQDNPRASYVAFRELSGCLGIGIASSLRSSQ